MLAKMNAYTKIVKLIKQAGAKEQVKGTLGNCFFAQYQRYAKKFNPRNINYMPVVKFFACLDFERKS